QSAAPLGRLDHDDAEGEPGERAVARREVTGERRHAAGELRHERSLRFDRARERAVLRRVHEVDTAAEGGDRACARAARGRGRSGGSVYRTRPCGQRIPADTVARRAGVALDPPRLDRPPAEGTSVGPRRACEGAPAPCRQTPTAGSLAPRAAMSAAPDSDRAGSGGTGRSSRGPRASSRDRTRGPSETRPAPAGSRVARSTPHRSSTGRRRRAGVADSGKGSRGDRGPPDRAHVPGRSPSPRRTPSRRLSPAPPAARAGAARPVAQAAAPRPTREAARAPAPAQGSAAALAA